MQALRIGMLGAARIGELALVEPARLLGHQVVAVSARSYDRAVDYAQTHGIPRAYASYKEVIDDPDVDVVYNPLVNSLHAEWNTAALLAGKTVLSEKPFTSNAAEAEKLREVAASVGGRIFEGFHYIHHPLTWRIRDIVQSGVLGDITTVGVDMRMLAPPASDPRWSLELAGGATMDLGCYALHAMRQFGRWTTGEPSLVGARGVELPGSPGVDRSMSMQLVYPGGLTGTVSVDMAADDTRMTWTITGDRGSVTAPSWPVPHRDDRVILTVDGHTTEERLGVRTSYTYQLEALAAALRGEAAFPIDIDDAVSNMKLVDATYTAADFPPRGRR